MIGCHSVRLLRLFGKSVARRLFVFKVARAHDLHVQPHWLQLSVPLPVAQLIFALVRLPRQASYRSMRCYS